MKLLRFSSVQVILILSLAFFSCKKDSNVGSNFIPNENKFTGLLVDTLSISAYTVTNDSTITQGIKKVIIGQLNDQEFGLTDGQFFGQFLLSTNSANFGTSPLVDSVVLSFYVDTIYGNSLQTTFKVFELDEAFNAAKTVYYSTNSLAYTNEIGNTLVNADTGTFSIKLQNTFAQKILNATGDTLANNANFLNLIKGISIKAEQASLNNNEGVLYTIDPYHPNTKIRIYYQNGSGAQTYDLKLISGTSRHFTKYSHDYTSTTDLQNQLLDPTLGNNRLFLQSFAGTHLNISFPTLKKWFTDHKALLHHAEIVFPIEIGSTSIFNAPKGAMLVYDSANLNKSFKRLPDRYTILNALPSMESNETYGGALETDKYRFIITQFLLNQLTGSLQDHLLLFPYENSTNISPQRTILNGSKNGSTPLKLLIYYTK